MVAFCLVRRRHGSAREVMPDASGELTDPAPASGILHTLRAGGLDAPMLALAEPRWAEL